MDTRVFEEDASLRVPLWEKVLCPLLSIADNYQHFIFLSGNLVYSRQIEKKKKKDPEEPITQQTVVPC